MRLMERTIESKEKTIEIMNDTSRKDYKKRLKTRWRYQEIEENYHNERQNNRNQKYNHRRIKTQEK